MVTNTSYVQPSSAHAYVEGSYYSLLSNVLHFDSSVACAELWCMFDAFMGMNAPAILMEAAKGIQAYSFVCLDWLVCTGVHTWGFAWDTKVQ